MPDPAQPLNINFPIIDPATGRPTEYFIRWAQQFSGDAASGSDLETIQNEIDNLSLDDLTDVDVSTDPPSNNQVLGFDGGSGLWVPKTSSGGGGWTPTPPVAADYTVDRHYSGIGASTVSDAVRGVGVLVTSPRNNTGSSWEQSYRLKAAPAGTAWRVEALISPYAQSSNNYFFDGIGAGFSGNGNKHLAIQSFFNGTSSVYLGRVGSYPGLNDNDDNSDTVVEQSISNDGFYSKPVWYALEYNQPTMTFLMSTDGYSWSEVSTIDADTYLGGTPDLIGFAHMSVAAASGDNYTRCPHWKETTNLSDPLGLNV